MQTLVLEEKLAKMKAWLQVYSETYPTSVGVGVIHRGACMETFFHGPASLRLRCRFLQRATFPIASLSKSLTAALALRMAETQVINSTSQ